MVKNMRNPLQNYRLLFVLLRLLILPLLMVTMTSCENNPSELGLKYDYSLYAYLLVGEPIDTDNPVRLKSLFNPDIPLYEQDISVTDALVRIYTESEPLIDAILVHEQNGEYVLRENDIFLIQPDTKYFLQIEVNDQIITASTHTPPASLIENDALSQDPDTFPELAIDVISSYPIKVSCPLGEERTCYLETYCLEEYNDAAYIYDFMGSGSPKDQEEYENPDGGFPRRLVVAEVFSPREHIDSENIVISNYDGFFFFYGRYRISCYVIDRNYYDSLYMTNGWEKGGVTGAYGVLGSGIGRIYYVKITDGS
jgi:hypothetical protein